MRTARCTRPRQPAATAGGWRPEANPAPLAAHGGRKGGEWPRARSAAARLVSAGDAERERPRAPDLSRGPGHRCGVGEAELGEALEPGFERDPELHAGQVRSQAAVDAEAERGVPVDLAIDHDLVRTVKLG